MNYMDLIGDDVELFLILALDVDGALSSGEVYNVGALQQRCYLFAGQ